MSDHLDRENLTLAIIGLGYVGLPLATEFGKHYQTIGFDIKDSRIAELKAGVDSTREVSKEELVSADKLLLTDTPEDLAGANVYIVTVPTPIDHHKKPNLTPLYTASEQVAKYLKKDDVVVYESTVFPGATEEECVPILEAHSGLVFNRDFFVGYSPERINPGDTHHRLTSILKVTSGSTPQTADFIDALYRSIISAGTYKATSIRVAEAAKVIENTQRDLNIALVNELAIIFRKLGLDTDEVLNTAATKWNFLPFRPGLVGGHCIGVDPYYLTFKAQDVGYEPDVILSGRRINDGMGRYVASELVKALLKRRLHVNDANILVMGLSFKENCPDIRNTKVIDVIRELEDYGANVDVYDPIVDPRDAEKEFGIALLDDIKPRSYDAAVVAVAHQGFVDLGENLKKYLKAEHVIFDVKGCLPAQIADLRL